MVRQPAHDLQCKVCLHAVADVRRTAGIEAPSTVFVLVPENLVDRALHLTRIARSKQGVHEDVIGLEHTVSFKFAAPVTVGMLLVKEPVARPRNPVRYTLEAKINPTKARLRRLFCSLRIG